MAISKATLALVGFAVVAGAANADTPGPDPLAPAAQGQLQCYEPNPAEKTCRAIGGYRALGQGRYLSTGTVLVSSDGPVTLETSSIVEVRHGAVCGSTTAGEILKGKLRVGGQLVTGEQAASARARIAKAMTPILGRTLCIRFEANNIGLIAKSTMKGYDGVMADQIVEWVSPKDGYSVGP